MSALVLEIATAPLEAVPAELAAVACFAEDRPLAGSAGRADWRLCGALSRGMRAGWLRGVAGEAALVPSGGGIAAPRVMALGLGPRADFDTPALARFCAEVVLRAARLRARSLALGWPDRIRIPPEGQVEALFSGLADAVGAAAGLARLWLCASAADSAALAQALRARADSLPRGVAFAASLAARDPRAPLPPAGAGGAAPIPRMRIK